MCCDGGCCLRLLIYLISFVVMGCAIACLVMDLKYGLDKPNDPNPTQPYVYWCLFVGTMFSAVPALYHMCSPRLIFILLMVLLSVGMFVVRLCLLSMDKQHIEFIFPLLLNAAIGCYYFYYAVTHYDDYAGSNGSSWDTLSRLESSRAPLSGSSDEQSPKQRSNKAKKKSTKKKKKTKSKKRRSNDSD